MSSWAQILERAGPAQHVVQLYGRDDHLLTRNVSRYLAEGLKREQGLLVTATEEHRSAIARQLRDDGAKPDGAVKSGRLLFLDAAATLDRFMARGQPDWEAFQEVIGGAIRQLRECTGAATIRAFGEMVGLLWTAGQEAEAIRLEEYWNRLLDASAVSLYCAYPIDVFDDAVPAAALTRILCTHHHLLTGSRTLLSSAAA